MHGSSMTLTGSSLPVCIPVSQPSAHVHGVHITLTEQINLRAPDTLLHRDLFMDWYLCMWCRGYMQINWISPPVGFIIISHFNEVATDIKTTRSWSHVPQGECGDRHQMAQTGKNWNAEAAFHTHLQIPQEGLSWMEGANQEKVKNNCVWERNKEMTIRRCAPRTRCWNVSGSSTDRKREPRWSVVWFHSTLLPLWRPQLPNGDTGNVTRLTSPSAT